MNRRPVLIMAGGTGGHVFPALAVASELRAREVPVVWLGTRRGIEARLVPEHGIAIEWLSIAGVRGKRLGTRLVFPLRVLRALAQAWSVFGRRRPCLALGMGGFVSGPGGLAAWLRRVPLVIHEQNAIPGLTNRVLARFATRTLEAVPRSFQGLAPGRVLHTGNPVRPEIAALPPPAQRLAGREGPLRVLVLGGSRGAAALNRIVPLACAAVAVDARPAIWHQTGEHGVPAEVREAYRGAGIEARVETFVADMAAAYAWSDLVVCRAGAITVAELAAAGAASILVPFPHAVDDHQTENARFLSGAGAAVLAPERELTPERLADHLQALSGARRRLLSMACAARDLARPQAAARVADVCLEVAL